MSVPLMLAGNRKIVGQIVGDIAYLPVESRHYLAVGKGYSIDDVVFRTILGAGCQWIDFWHKKTSRHFRVRVETFKTHARPFEFGFGRKWAAPMDCYEPQPQGQEA
jgi:hypothetical protein